MRRRMIERLEQRRLLSGCCPGGMSGAGMGHAAMIKEMADQLAGPDHQAMGQNAQPHVDQTDGHGRSSVGDSGQEDSVHDGQIGTSQGEQDGKGQGEHSHGQGRHTAQSITLRHGLLKVRGTRGDDTVTIAPNVDDPTKLDVTLNGSTQSFALADVQRIRVMTGRGNDTVQIDPSLDIPSTINGRRGR
jgi:hypothetical protein